MVKLTCKRHFGEIYRIDSWHLLDQISDEENKIINSRSINQYLKDNYNISLQQYYNICIYGNANEIPICPICGNPRIYRGKLIGYTSTCNSDKCNSIRIGNNFKSYWKNFWENSSESEINNYRKFLSEKARSLMLLYPDHGSERLNDPISSAKRHRNTFIHQHTIYDECLFYIVNLGGRVKYGISTRINLPGRLKFYGSDRYKILFEGSKYLMAYLEFLISSELASEYISNSKLGSLAHTIYKNANKLQLI